MSFLTNSDGKPQIFWHGTCADFDIFYPLSQFAVDKCVSDSSQFYSEVRAPLKERLNPDFLQNETEQFVKRVMAISDPLSKTESIVKKTKEIKYHPNFKLIPVQLKMNNPLRLDSWVFDFEASLIGLVWGVNQFSEVTKLHDADAMSDFVFKDTQNRSYDEVRRELMLGHLFVISPNEEENRYHLTAQRFILLLEKHGYDGIQYDVMKDSVDAYRLGKVRDFDNCCYVNFRPEQIVRLDKEVNVPSTQPSVGERIELNKIYYQYLQTHKSYLINRQELIHRLTWGSIIKNQLPSR